MEIVSSSSIKNYLASKNIKYQERGNEIIIRCVYSDCDRDSKGNEAHLYINASNGTNYCFKCGFKGNMLTICKLFDDKPEDFFNLKTGFTKRPQSKTRLDVVVEKCCRELPIRVREYLNARGITDEIIEKYHIGYGEFYEKPWITIPIKDAKGKFSFIKLKRDPDDISNPDKGKCYPFGISAELYNWETLFEAKDHVVLCEGEPDCLLLLAQGIPAVTSTGGAGTFKDEWVQNFAHLNKVYICYDNDKAGKAGAERVLKMFGGAAKLGIKTFKIDLSEMEAGYKDVTDWIIKLKNPATDLIEKFASEYPEREKIDVSQFSPMTTRELIEILGLTIKHDQSNKLLTFLAALSAFTEVCQLNITFNAPSSTGKSYIPLEISSYFSEEDKIIVAYCSPTAFFHDHGKLNPDTREMLVDLSRKLLIFLDQPHSLLLSHLRPMLSHDRKELKIKITDKNEKGGQRTKNILLRGYPAVVFCTANFEVDEQESTRFLMLSPETSQEKIREGLYITMQKEEDTQAFEYWLEQDPRRQLLKKRIEAIKQEHIMYIKLAETDTLKELFEEKYKILKPRHARDIRKIIYIAKCLALLDCWWRDKNADTITASTNDIKEAFNLWAEISDSQELNLPPYVYKLFQEVFAPLWQTKNIEIVEGTEPVGLTRKEVMKKHIEVYGRPIKDAFLRQQVLVALDNAGLIYEEGDPKDQRRQLIFLANMTPEKTKVSDEDRNQEAVSFDELIQQAEITPDQSPQTLL